jgi:ribosomal protein S12 methylthiotransferase accessory factor
MGIELLSGPYLSAMGVPERLPLLNFNDRALAAYQCKSASMSQLFNYVRDWSGEEAFDGGLYGAACEFSADLAELKAMGEAAERYTSAAISHSDLLVSTALDLGPKAFRWSRLPRLSTEELHDPRQTLHSFDENHCIRWIPSMDMHAQRVAYVPLILTHLYPRAWTSERFAFPISTGTALHPDPCQAMLSAVLEVIERDALALNWLLQRPLRRIRLEAHDRNLFDESTWLLVNRVDLVFYEATTDIGVPTIYARRHCPAHPTSVNVFGCSSSLDLCAALGKAAREAIMIGHALDANPHQPPKSTLDCRHLVDGAMMMMRPDSTDAFAYLDDAEKVTLGELLTPALPHGTSAKAQLDWVIRRLKEEDQPVYLTDISCDEILDAGLRGFRALIPGLMPLSFVHRSRFLASPRLAQMHGYWSLAGTLEQRISPWPQPFS